MTFSVPFPFHEITSLHPPSFQRNDFSTGARYAAHKRLWSPCNYEKQDPCTVKPHLVVTQ